MHRDGAYFADILNSAELAVSYVKEITFENFENNSALQDAVIRRIEIIGEASQRISSETKLKYKHLPWKEMKGMRNFLIHEYGEINIEEVWNTIKNDIPELIKKIKEII